ncbi:MAG TPA: hypothetical protein VIO11_06395 [Candidatus Methanoperedens sp.]
MSRPKGSKNKKLMQLSFDTVKTEGIPDLQVYENSLTQNEVINTMEITHALRVINQGNFPEIEQEMKVKFFDKGWRLFATHFGGMQPEGMIIIYIFIKEQ